jgi:hypothetical protein
MSACFKTVIVCKHSATLAYLYCDRWACPGCNKKLRKKWADHVEMWMRGQESLYRLEMPVNSPDWEKLTARIRYRAGDYVNIRAGDVEAVYSNVPFKSCGISAERVQSANAIRWMRADVRKLKHAICRPISTSRGVKLPEDIDSGEKKTKHVIVKAGSSTFARAATSAGTVVEDHEHGRVARFENAEQRRKFISTLNLIDVSRTESVSNLWHLLENDDSASIGFGIVDPSVVQMWKTCHSLVF